MHASKQDGQEVPQDTSQPPTHQHQQAQGDEMQKKTSLLGQGQLHSRASLLGNEKRPGGVLTDVQRKLTGLRGFTWAKVVIGLAVISVVMQIRKEAMTFTDSDSLSASVQLISRRFANEPGDSLFSSEEEQEDDDVIVAPVLDHLNDAEDGSVSGSDGEEEEEEEDGSDDSGDGSETRVYVDEDSVSLLLNTSKHLRKYSRLPRTGTGPYNLIKPDEKYLIYSPSGGFNNQLACFLSASYLARLYNRTMIVPMNGKHSSMTWAYYGLKDRDVIPMDHALDFQYMGEKLGVRLLPLNMTIKEFQYKHFGQHRLSNSKVQVIKAPKTGLFKLGTKDHKRYERMGGRSNKKFVWFEGRFYTKYWARRHGLYRFIRYTPYLRKLAKEIANEAFKGKQFNCMHIRLGDYLNQVKERSKDGRSFLRAATRYGWKKDTPVYIATDGESQKNYFRPIKKYFKKVMFQTDLSKNHKIKRYLQEFTHNLPKSEIRSDLFGLVEQMLCVRSKHFVGTSVSTFSQTIAKTRRTITNTVPDIPQEYVGKTALIHWDGKLTYYKRPESATDKGSDNDDTDMDSKD